MFTNNYYGLLTNVFTGMYSSIVVNVNGYISSHVPSTVGNGAFMIGTRDSTSYPHQGLYYIHKLLSSYGENYGNGVILGDGDNPESIEDYKLSGNVVSGYQYFERTYTYPESKDNGLFERKAYYTLTNNTKNPMTIKEIGYLIQGVLIDRTVLKIPLTIEPNGGVGKITYSLVTMPQFTLPPTGIDVDADDVYTVCRYDGDGSMRRLGGSRDFPNPVLGKSSPFDNISPWKDMKRYNIVNNQISVSEDSELFDPELETVVYIPVFYYHFYSNPNISSTRLSISATPKNGYIKHPGSGRYVGKYFATTGEDGTLKSQPGKKLENQKELIEYRKIHERGENFFMMDYVTMEAILILFYVEFNTFNITNLYNINSRSFYATEFYNNIITGHTKNESYHSNNYSNYYTSYRHIENFLRTIGTVVDGIKYENGLISIKTNPNLDYDIKTEIEDEKYQTHNDYKVGKRVAKFIICDSTQKQCPILVGHSKNLKAYSSTNLNRTFYYKNGEGMRLFSPTASIYDSEMYKQDNITIPSMGHFLYTNSSNSDNIYYNYGSTRIMYVP